MGWTQADVETLKQLWLEEGAAAIGEVIGKTRNAVIGMAHRLGLPRKISTNGHQKGEPRTPKSSSIRKFKPRRNPPPPSQPQDPIPLLMATSSQCKAVIDNLKDENGLAMVCGKLIPAGQSFSFCSEHLEKFTTLSSRGYGNVGGRPINQQLQQNKR